MKILFVNSFYYPDVGGGAELTMKTIADGMVKKGHSVYCVCTKAGEGVDVDKVDGVTVYRIGIKNIYWHFGRDLPGKLKRFRWHCADIFNNSMQKEFENVLNEIMPDVVSCHNLAGFSVSAWDALIKKSIPFVQVLHDFYLLCPNSSMFKKGCACEAQCKLCSAFRYRHLALSQNVGSVVGVSKFVLDRFSKGGYFRDAKKFVIHCSAHIEETALGPQRINSEPLRVGYIGTIIPTKGVGWLLDQFKRVSGAATLSIAGTGPEDYVNKLKSEAEGFNVNFLGYVKSAEFFKEIDVCVVPSLWPEVLGRVAFEACASNVPVVASAMGGLTEIVQNGVNGFLCNPNEPDSLGEALDKLSNDASLLCRLKEQSRGSVRGFLDIEHLAEEYESIFLQIR